MIRIGFFGTPELAASVLSDIIEHSGFEVVFTVSNPDKPFGRNQILRPSPVKILALEKGIPVFTPEKIRNNTEFLEKITSFQCDYFIVVAYGRILPLAILEAPKKMCINVHGSILPAYRGASPIQSALLNGEKETGVTIMEMSEKMDEGNILKIRTIAITDDETSETLFQKFAEISGPTLVQTLEEIEHGGITSLPQEHDKAKYCTKIEKEDGKIDWSKSAEEIYHMWQAYTPWPGIYTIYEGKRLLLENVAVYYHSEERSDPEKLKGIPQSDGIASQARNDGNIGTVLKLEDGTIGVVCGTGILTLLQVKLEGKKSQGIKDFLNGNQSLISSVL